MILKSNYWLLAILTLPLFSKAEYWQQRVEYTMQIDMDAERHQFTGDQKLVYYNNSPDTLHRVFYHLYFNAFQPGSMMDVRSRTISDPDSRIGSRIAGLKENEIGYHKIKSLSQDGHALKYKIEHTILEVELAKPILPGSSTIFQMKFESQVPIQIRRSGRQNHEGIAYSMSQWYPKLCEYDERGWHANPYVAREFHGVWGDFDIKISIDSSYTIGGTGYLQNPQQIGHGYIAKNEVTRTNAKKLIWHFKAPKVHDFVWAADPDYKHVVRKTESGIDLHFFYQAADSLTKEWTRLPAKTEALIDYFSQHFGQYPYKQYSVIQGGDGGMEYPMATLITGRRRYGSLVGVTSHEMAHSWFQGLLASDESLYPWMDEGFTEYASNQAFHTVMWPSKEVSHHVHWSSYRSYFNLVNQGNDEPSSTHADHYLSNRVYGVNAYSKGEVFITQLAYIIGQENLDKTMLQYFDEWAFKHPRPIDFIRVAEKVAQMELDWYLEYWVETTKTIDYGIKSVEENELGVSITLEKIGAFPMPVDIVISLKGGHKQSYNIPLSVMRNEKKGYALLPDWPWTHPQYSFKIEGITSEDIERIEIDPQFLSADVDRTNNVYPFPKQRFWDRFKRNERK